MKLLFLATLLLCLPHFGSADNTFVAYTPLGTLSGECTAQVLETKGYREYWKLTLGFRPSGRRSRSLSAARSFLRHVPGAEPGRRQLRVDAAVVGDFVVKPDDPESIAEIAVTAPLYETRPHEIIISQISRATG